MKMELVEKKLDMSSTFGLLDLGTFLNYLHHYDDLQIKVTSMNCSNKCLYSRIINKTLW